MLQKHSKCFLVLNNRQGQNKEIKVNEKDGGKPNVHHQLTKRIYPRRFTISGVGDLIVWQVCDDFIRNIVNSFIEVFCKNSPMRFLNEVISRSLLTAVFLRQRWSFLIIRRFLLCALWRKFILVFLIKPQIRQAEVRIEWMHALLRSNLFLIERALFLSKGQRDFVMPATLPLTLIKCLFQVSLLSRVLSPPPLPDIWYG